MTNERFWKLVDKHGVVLKDDYENLVDDVLHFNKNDYDESALDLELFEYYGYESGKVPNDVKNILKSKTNKGK